MIKKLLPAAALLLLALAFPSTAQAANVACYDWVCDADTYTCTFDASCTQNDGMLWRYRWDFGDGSGPFLTGNPVITHQYPQYYSWGYVELTVVDYDQDPFSVSCEVVVSSQVGPPTGGSSGRCSQ